MPRRKPNRRRISYAQSCSCVRRWPRKLTAQWYSGDWFGIASVFTVSTPEGNEDQVWYFIVDGLEASPWFGTLVGDPLLLGTHPIIRTVDCTNDSYDRVYVAWDRQTSTPWERMPAKIDRLSVAYDPVEGDYDPVHHISWPSAIDVGATCLAPYPPERSVFAYRPRVAWSPSYGSEGSLLVATNEWSTETGGPSGSGFCYLALYASNGDQISYFGMVPEPGSYATAWDVEWSEVDNFVLLYRWAVDWTVDHMYGTAIVQPGGGPPVATNIYFDDPPDGNKPQGSVLVLSPNSSNPERRLMGFTDRKAYWIRTNGTRYGSLTGYDPSPRMPAACEYWGSLARIAHSFTPVTAPVRTMHRHWRLSPLFSPSESLSVNKTLYPVACATSDSEADPHPNVAVVSYNSTDYLKVYWNLFDDD